MNAMALTDVKGRYQIDGDRIRATYGHSLDLDLDLPTDNIPPALYYPAAEEEADMILEDGLKPTDRRFVHLSKTYQDAATAGQFRGGAGLILQIDTKAAGDDGLVIKRAGKTVFLCETVKPDFLSKAEQPAEADGGKDTA